MGMSYTVQERVANADRLGIIVDADSYHLLENYTWYLHGRGMYPRAKIRLDDGTRTDIFLHHLVVGRAPDGLIPDHKDRNTRNNRRDNLRFRTYSQNTCNSPITDFHDMIGITETELGSWQVKIMRQRKWHYLGRFNDLAAAKQARNDLLTRLSEDEYERT